MDNEDILLTLHSITNVEIVDGVLEVRFADYGDEVFTAVEFRSDSFTRELFQLIERHLSE